MERTSRGAVILAAAWTAAFRFGIEAPFELRFFAILQNSWCAVVNARRKDVVLCL